MKKIYSLSLPLTLAVFLSAGAFAQSQQPTQPTQPNQATQPNAPDTQTPGQQPQAQPSQAPDAASPAPSATASAAQPADGQNFSGTVVKLGDKYVLQDATGTSYDIDNQDEAKKFEGKKVKIHGKLDANGKTIHVQ